MTNENGNTIRLIKLVKCLEWLRKLKELILVYILTEVTCEMKKLKFHKLNFTYGLVYLIKCKDY